MKTYNYNTYTVRLNDELNTYMKQQAEHLHLSVQNAIRSVLAERMNEDRTQTDSTFHG